MREAKVLTWREGVKPVNVPPSIPRINSFSMWNT